ncbi:MAG: cytochrome bd ubiquinol oxidase subunit [Thermoleophilaceae bacterium]|jgi:cytochrome d ubiquinol oxidase subunit II|nr:cytochrome bd ubiquinol oxidase subunit [Thermoleophilaceae bacterium]MEA2470603.1 cytochrome bd ubiquinol oxidase subunit [Thermoleophilaceae bacterium]
MHLYTVPLVLVLAGLVLYAVLGGADFGAGLWQLLAGGGERGRRVRDHAHHALAPVWEANHVWILFVVTVSWTAYPQAFASIASTLSVALFIAGLGIIFRGASYALRAGVEDPQKVDVVFALSSILTPFALGAAVGGIASMRVPVGNAAGDLLSSWLNPTSVLVGLLAVVFSGYLAAVYLAADSRRLGDAELEDYFRGRALVAALVAGALAVAGLLVLHSDARRLFDGLVDGDGLPALIVSGLAGAATFWLVWRRRYELARVGASLAVAAVMVGWALAQQPVILPGLTVSQAAAPHETLVAVIVAVVAGAVVLFPSLALLFSLVLRGRFDRARPAEPPTAPRSADLMRASRRGLLVRSALACLVAGVGFLNVAEAGWAHAIGVAALVVFVLLGFLALVPRDLAT